MLKKKPKHLPFQFEEKETQIDFFINKPFLWNLNLNEYRDRTLREALYEKPIEIYHGKFTKDNIKQEWHNLQTMFKREKARMEASRVSGSAIFDLFILNWDFNSQMEFLRVSCNVDESFSSLESKPYEPPKKECSINFKNEEQIAKAELWRTLAATLKSNQNGSGNSYHGANVGDNMPSDRVSLFGKLVADTLCNMVRRNGYT